MLATSSDPLLRNGTEAVQLAEHANRVSGGKRPIILRILAAAYAEAGRFDDAMEVAEKALELSGSEDARGLETALRKEITLYRSGAAYHKEAP